MKTSPTQVAVFKYLIEVVAKHFDVSKAFIISGERSTKTAASRQLAMYLCRTDLHMKFDTIAQKFDRSRPTVIRSVRKVEEALRAGTPNSTRTNTDLRHIRSAMRDAGMVLTPRNGQAKTSHSTASKADAVPPRKALRAPRQSDRRVSPKGEKAT